jgi:hypothetical protein
MQKMYVTKTLIENVDFDELDIDLQEEFEFKFNYEDDDEFEVIDKGRGRADGYPVNIDRMIAKLQELKNAGSTHVELDYHCDHIGYEISGYEIRLSTEEEKQEFDEINKQEREKQQKIRDLYNQINEIKKS